VSRSASSFLEEIDDWQGSAAKSPLCRFWCILGFAFLPLHIPLGYLCVHHSFGPGDFIQSLLADVLIYSAMLRHLSCRFSTISLSLGVSNIRLLRTHFPQEENQPFLPFPIFSTSRALPSLRNIRASTPRLPLSNPLPNGHRANPISIPRRVNLSRCPLWRWR
jgi:hypothetical protein